MTQPGNGNLKALGRWAALAAIGLVCLQPTAGLACAACYGQSDSALAQGMNWGILSLLAIVVTVLGGIASFFIYLARRSNQYPPISSP